MQMNINFPAEVESALKRRAAAAGQDVETLVTNILVEEVADEVEPRKRRRISPEEFARRTAAWIKLHPAIDHAIDDSRESIYAGRGE
jgi:hypothetical protein